MSYIASNCVDIFPTSKDRSSQRSSRVLYEDNIANIIRQLSDVPSFIITPKINSSNIYLDSSGQLQGGDIEFCLYGYYVKIKKGTSIPIDNSTNAFIQVYAQLMGVSTEESGKTYELPFEIQGVDNDITNKDKYTGLDFITSNEQTNTARLNNNGGIRTIDIYFTLFQRHETTDDGVTTVTYKPCEESFNKFRSGAITFDSIDGKHN